MPKSILLLVIAVLALGPIFGTVRPACQSHPVVPDFTITCTPNENTITAGSDTVYTVAVKPIGGWINAVQLNANELPKLARAEFSPNPIPVGGATSTLKLSNTATLAPGTYTFKITAQLITRNPTASDYQKTKCTLRVTKPKRNPRDFNIVVSPTSAAADQGHTASYHITIIPKNGFNEAIGIGLSASVRGISMGLGTTPEYRRPYHPGVFVLTIDPAVRSGTYAFGVWATARSVRHFANAQVIVRRQ
jgi:hypothetical protein